MTRLQKWMVGGVVGLLLILYSPVAYTRLTPPGFTGYYADSRCACGHDSYIRIEDDGYYQFAPGHRRPEKKLFTLKAEGNEWQLVREKESSDLFLVITNETFDGTLSRLRFEGGDLLISGPSGHWERHERIVNPWPIWLAKWRER